MSSKRNQRGKLITLLVLGLLHAAISIWGVAPGHLSVDEGTYHLMVRDRAAGYGFEIRNGYREIPSPELMPATLVVHDGGLRAVPPEFFTFLACPFYLALGYRGLFALSALAFAATVALTARLAWRLTGRREVALDAALLLTVGTYLWEYSQAAWPHASATLLVVAAFTALAEAWRAAGPRSRLGWAALAGLLGAVAVGVRMDSVLALPALVLPFLFLRPPSLAPALASVAGMAPPLAVLAWINAVKFGVARPLTYGLDKPGGELAAYLPVGALAAVALAGAWLASRNRSVELLAGRDRRRRRWAAAGALIVVLAGLLVVVPTLREAALAAASGLGQLLVDLRLRPPSWEPALARTPQGGMVYLGALKKSLLQSCPWLAALVLLAVPAGGEAHRRWGGGVLLLLALVPAAYVGFYGALAWHGGLALNLRYFTPALPFLAVLGALAWRTLERSDGEQRALPSRWLLAVSAGAAIALHLGLRWLTPGVEAQQFVLLDLPLALATLLAASALLSGLLAAHGRPARAWRRSTALLFAAGVAWAAAVAFTYDYPLQRTHRARNLAFGSELRPRVPADAILFVHTPDAYYSLLEVPGIRLAVPPADRFADFRRLVGWHLDRDRPVLVSWPPDVWQRVGRAGLLGDLVIRPQTPDGRLVSVLRRPPQPAAPGPADTGRGSGPTPPPR